ncbi:AcrB/AcrD/AcrF family protein [Sesbania bispinosa]|nr:AcrB/AcrD/AcrF family protein [Sesbania bispinosa]
MDEGDGCLGVAICREEDKPQRFHKRDEIPLISLKDGSTKKLGDLLSQTQILSECKSDPLITKKNVYI